MSTTSFDSESLPQPVQKERHPTPATHEDLLAHGFLSHVDGDGHYYTNGDLHCERCGSSACGIRSAFILPSGEWTFGGCRRCKSSKTKCSLASKAISARYFPFPTTPSGAPSSSTQVINYKWKKSDIVDRERQTVGTRKSTISDRTRRLRGDREPGYVLPQPSRTRRHHATGVAETTEIIRAGSIDDRLKDHDELGPEGGGYEVLENDFDTYGLDSYLDPNAGGFEGEEFIDWDGLGGNGPNEPENDRGSPHENGDETGQARPDQAHAAEGTLDIDIEQGRLNASFSLELNTPRIRKRRLRPVSEEDDGYLQGRKDFDMNRIGLEAMAWAEKIDPREETTATPRVSAGSSADARNRIGLGTSTGVIQDTGNGQSNSGLAPSTFSTPVPSCALMGSNSKDDIILGIHELSGHLQTHFSTYATVVRERDDLLAEISKVQGDLQKERRTATTYQDKHEEVLERQNELQNKIEQERRLRKEIEDDLRSKQADLIASESVNRALLSEIDDLRSRHLAQEKDKDESQVALRAEATARSLAETKARALEEKLESLTQENATSSRLIQDLQIQLQAARSTETNQGRREQDSQLRLALLQADCDQLRRSAQFHTEELRLLETSLSHTQSLHQEQLQQWDSRFEQVSAQLESSLETVRRLELELQTSKQQLRLQCHKVTAAEAEKNRALEAYHEKQKDFDLVTEKLARAEQEAIKVSEQSEDRGQLLTQYTLENDDLRSRLQKLETDLNNRITDLQSRFDIDTAAQRLQIADLKEAHLREREDLVRRHSSSLATLTAEKADLNAKLIEKQTTIADLEEEIARLDRNIVETSQRERQTSNEVEVLRARAKREARLDKQISNLQSALLKAKGEVELAERRIQFLEKDREEL